MIRPADMAFHRSAFHHSSCILGRVVEASIFQSLPTTRNDPAGPPQKGCPYSLGLNFQHHSSHRPAAEL